MAEGTDQFLRISRGFWYWPFLVFLTLEALLSRLMLTCISGEWWENYVQGRPHAHVSLQGVLQLQTQPHLGGRLKAKASSDGLEVQRVHVEDLLELVGVIGQDV